MQREYDGKPLDMTWDSGPWANDGETVEATNGDHGTMTTVEWPEGATDPKELNDDQREIIKTAARNPEIDNWAEIQRRADVDKSGNSYAADTLKNHWPQRRKKDAPVDDTSSSGRNRALGHREVDKVRIGLLNGYSLADLQNQYDVSKETITKAAKGDWPYMSVDCKTPPLSTVGNTTNTEWTITNEDIKQIHKNINEPYPSSTADVWRKQALNGRSATDIAREYSNISPRDVKDVLRGDSGIDGNPSQPPLKWWNKKRQWVERKPDAEQQTIELDSDARGEPESEPTLDGQSVSKQPSVSTDSGVSKRAIAGVVGVVVTVLYILRRLW